MVVKKSNKQSNTVLAVCHGSKHSDKNVKHVISKFIKKGKTFDTLDTNPSTDPTFIVNLNSYNQWKLVKNSQYSLIIAMHCPILSETPIMSIEKLLNFAGEKLKKNGKLIIPLYSIPNLESQPFYKKLFGPNDKSKYSNVKRVKGDSLYDFYIVITNDN